MSKTIKQRGALLVVCASLMATSLAQANPKKTCTWRTSDIIDKRIDVGAQKSLMRMMSRGGKDQKRASAMIYAVKRKLIDGIYLPPRGPVINRGKAMRPQKGYWQIIPRGKDSICLKQPAGFKPVMVYREKMSNARVDAALKSAFDACKLPLPKACDYKTDRWKPTPPPKPKNECSRDSQCGNMGCCKNGKCEMCFPDNNVGPIRCNKDFAWTQCPSGWFCRRGKCVDGKPRARCEDKSIAKYKESKQRCSNENKKRHYDCAKKTIKDVYKKPYSVVWNAVKGTACAGRSKYVFDKCTRKAYNVHQSELKACKGSNSSSIRSGSKRKRIRAPRRRIKRR